MSELEWHEKMNAEYDAALSDDERYEVLRKYMSDSEAQRTLGHVQSGRTTSAVIKKRSTSRRKGS